MRVSVKRLLAIFALLLSLRHTVALVLLLFDVADKR